MSQKTKENSLHHYVQRAYLGRFADDGRIDVIDRATGEVRLRQPIASVAAIKGLYNYTSENGETIGDLEDALESDIESPAQNIMAALCSGSPSVPNQKDRVILARYVALQYMRTLEHKRKMELHANLSMEIQIFNLTHNRDEIRQVLLARGKDASEEAIDKIQELLKDAKRYPELVPPQNLWIRYLAEGTLCVAPILVERFRWNLMLFKDHSLLTGDHPVVLRRIHHDVRGVGFLNADEIIFPLSTRVALALSIDKTIPETVLDDVQQSVADMVNSYIVNGSYLEFYSHPTLTSKYSQKPLGERPLFSVGGGLASELEFFQKYDKPPKRRRPRR